MKNKFVHQLLSVGLTCAFFLFASGCVTIDLGSTPSETEPPIPTQPPVEPQLPEPLPSAPALTEETLLNARLLSPMLQAPIQLVEGSFSGVVDGVDLTARALPGIQFGELNGDGIPDAAWLLAEDTGGSGVFVSLMVVYSQAELFRQAPGILIDDRPVIDVVSIEDGVVKISGLVHGPNDPMVDPTTVISAEYRLFGDRLVESHLVAAFSGGSEHRIQIDAPLEGEEVSGSFLISGSMPIGPFENNLALKILDKAGNQLLYQGFMVQAEDMGAPATFANPVDLPSVAAGTEILVMLSELSMADGTPIAIDSVLVKVK